MRDRSAGALEQVVREEAVPGVLSVYSWKNVDFVLWHTSGSAEAVESLRRVTERRRRKHPEGISVVHVVQGSVNMPDAATREALVKLMKDVEGFVSAVAVVIGGTGFWASSLRSLVTGMKMLARSSFEMRLHGRVEEVLAWLPAAHHKRTGVHVEASDLAQALREAVPSD